MVLGTKKSEAPQTNKLFDQRAVDHAAVIDKIVQESSPRKTFLLLIIVSSVMAAIGLLNDSAAIVIGAMLVAPLLWPILGISMGLLLRDFKMIWLSTLSIIFSIILALGTAILITFQYIPLGASNEIMNQTTVNFMIPVAIASGIAAAFAVSYEHIKEAVTGVAISVALIPPLVTIGIGLGGTDWSLVTRASNVFVINLFGIIITSLIIFALLGFGSQRRAAENAVKKEEKVLKTQ